MQNESDFRFLKKLAVSDINFLALDEKLVFEKYLDSISDKTGFDSMFSKFKSISKEEISEIVGRKFVRASWNGDKILKKALYSKKIIDAFGIKSVFYGEKSFPVMLTKSSSVSDPPFSVFFRGNLEVLKNKCVSVVGTRRANVTAKKAAFDFARDACDDNSTVISGLAFGIDIEAHKGALSSLKSATAAVLPGGIDVIAPSSHTRYAMKIIEKNGLVMSEYLPGTPAEKFRFVQRNRIVAALSPATVVVQAPAGSGSMITAGLALDYNREVFMHSVNFNEQSKKLDEITKNQFMMELFSGEKSEKTVVSKIDNSPQAFVQAGAKIISSYDDYKKLLYQNQE